MITSKIGHLADISAREMWKSLRIYLKCEEKNVLTPFFDFARCVMLLFLRFYLFLKEGELEWLVHSIIGATLEDLFTI